MRYTIFSKYTNLLLGISNDNYLIMMIEAEISEQESVDAADYLYTDSYDLISVISGFEYRWFCGAAIPYVLYKDENSDGAFPLMGYHAFKMSRSRLCPECFKILEDGEYLCNTCQESDLHKRLRCILDGPGVPFKLDCTIKHPACGLSKWSESVCYSDWILYVASVFGIPKVGISRKSKDGCSMGFTKRLLAQGAESWIVLGPINGLERALVMESKIADELMYTKSVTTKEKWYHFVSGELNCSLPRRNIIEVAREQELSIFLEGSFSEYYNRGMECDEMRLVDASEGLQGQLVSSYGPFMGFLKENTIRVCSIEKAVGSVILGGL